MGWPRTDERDVATIDLKEFPRVELLYDSAKMTADEAVDEFMHFLMGLNVVAKSMDRPIALGITRPGASASPF
jgi:hypothetical protein